MYFHIAYTSTNSPAKLTGEKRKAVKIMDKMKL